MFDYTSPKWRSLRASVLRQDKYIDQYQKRYGKYYNADIVHHIFPTRDFPQYAYERWNLISISRRTHEMMHDRETDLLSEKGIELLRRTARKNNIPIPEGYLEQKKPKVSLMYGQGKGFYG